MTKWVILYITSAVIDFILAGINLHNGAMPLVWGGLGIFALCVAYVLWTEM